MAGKSFHQPQTVQLAVQAFHSPCQNGPFSIWFDACGAARQCSDLSG